MTAVIMPKGISKKKMNVSEIFEEIKNTPGSIAKSKLLKEHRSNKLFKTALKMGLDNFIPFNVVQVPKVTTRLEYPLTEAAGWQEFFVVLNECASRIITGNAAITRVLTCLSSVQPEDEFWMRKILQKKLAIGASTKTVNKVYPGLIPTFEVSLAQKFNEKRIADMDEVIIEPKLDGIRCFAVVENGKAMLFARSGKLIPNFDNTIGAELEKLGNGCYDGELMGKDFIALMRQAYRKDDVNTDGTYLALFDYLPIGEWKTASSKMTCRDRYNVLLDRLSNTKDLDPKLVQHVLRRTINADYAEIKGAHDEFVHEGFEGVMIKDPHASYKFGRGYEVMKFKAFHDVDLAIRGLEEGTGKHSGRLGAIKVEFHGIPLRVGSGFSDELRDVIWASPKDFIDRVVEIRYQEVTPDGSLRFPTFVCFRNDKGNP